MAVQGHHTTPSAGNYYESSMPSYHHHQHPQQLQDSNNYYNSMAHQQADSAAATTPTTNLAFNHDNNNQHHNHNHNHHHHQQQQQQTPTGWQHSPPPPLPPPPPVAGANLSPTSTSPLQLATSPHHHQHHRFHIGAGGGVTSPLQSSSGQLSPYPTNAPSLQTNGYNIHQTHHQTDSTFVPTPQVHHPNHHHHHHLNQRQAQHQQQQHHHLAHQNQHSQLGQHEVLPINQHHGQFVPHYNNPPGAAINVQQHQHFHHQQSIQPTDHQDLLPGSIPYHQAHHNISGHNYSAHLQQHYQQHQHQHHHHHPHPQHIHMNHQNHNNTQVINYQSDQSQIHRAGVLNSCSQLNKQHASSSPLSHLQHSSSPSIIRPTGSQANNPQQSTRVEYGQHNQARTGLQTPGATGAATSDITGVHCINQSPTLTPPVVITAAAAVATTTTTSSLTPISGQYCQRRQSGSAVSTSSAGSSDQSQPMASPLSSPLTSSHSSLQIKHQPVSNNNANTTSSTSTNDCRQQLDSQHQADVPNIKSSLSSESIVENNGQQVAAVVGADGGTKESQLSKLHQQCAVILDEQQQQHRATIISTNTPTMDRNNGTGANSNNDNNNVNIDCGSNLNNTNINSSSNNNNLTNNPTNNGNTTRLKRLRTSFKHNQLKEMKRWFSKNQNPDAKDLKTLSQTTGLSKRVLQVWFQNARAKFRRNNAKAANQQLYDVNQHASHILQFQPPQHHHHQQTYLHQHQQQHHHQQQQHHPLNTHPQSHSRPSQTTNLTDKLVSNELSGQQQQPPPTQHHLAVQNNAPTNLARPFVPFSASPIQLSGAVGGGGGGINGDSMNLTQTTNGL